MSTSRSCARLHGLLPIIAIVFVLLPILASAVHRARAMSEQQICTENLKRLGVAAEMYQADWDDVLLPYGTPFGYWNANPPGKMWPELLDAYMHKIPGGHIDTTKFPREYRCPSVPDQTGFAYERTYGMNQRCGGWMPGGRADVVPVRRVKYPQATIRIAEVEWAAQGGSYFAATPSEYIPGDPTCHRFAVRHNGKGNVLWIDGHVSAMALAQYNMRDNQVDPNIWLRMAGPKPAVP